MMRASLSTLRTLKPQMFTVSTHTFPYGGTLPSSVGGNQVLFPRFMSGGESENAHPASDLIARVKEKRIRNERIHRDPTDYTLAHPLWEDLEVENVKEEHTPPQNFRDRLAYWTIQTIRFNFDVLTGYKFGELTTKKWVNRLVFLETIAGVPGSAAGVIRHLNSLRRLERDHGWIHTLLEEAENERMHLMTFLELKEPGLMFRLAVGASQFVFWNFYFMSYLISPKFCHKMVGYLEEEAVVTYSKLVRHLEEGRYPEWQNKKPPQIAMKYWMLNENTRMIDLIKVIRADEAHHRDCNHLLASLNSKEDNPIPPGH
eukprot:CAMPEP_0201479200 /NCGR_PEP_ID=MMETSP0151_2-20130828/3911_1 /ASSEMBLY_ACC=CAM_ASM_000257 /TAXON_ID=200890 /ORGANISM="Paramoeba atlantica, Strain 621/1 / CCAP 1560/9" /LENGTH=314 /DNA_ID=CAMNT_0047860565 /DNA_START=37 /DNA_END=981 /DNA_ORIENTATION=+